MRDLFKQQGLKGKIIGINHDYEGRLSTPGQKIGIMIQQDELDEFFFEKEEVHSMFHVDYGRTVFGRSCWNPACSNLFRAIRLELYSNLIPQGEFSLFR